VENDGLRLDIPDLDVDLVSGEDDGDVFANANEISMPVRDILEGDSRCDVEHDDRALAHVESVSVPAGEHLLAGTIKNLEPEMTTSKTS
jgi:hypothetical protein